MEEDEPKAKNERETRHNPAPAPPPSDETLRHPLRLSGEILEVVEAWESLPAPLRAAVLALVRASHPRTDT